jgi:terminase small subunit-like protein
MTRVEPMLTRSPPRGLAAAPGHFAEPEADLWRQLVASYRFDDPASLELLRQALEARARARLCRETVEREGATVRDDHGTQKAHPLLAIERSAQASFLSAMRLLRLDIGGGKDK